jgi:hypothetical protein
VGEKIKRSCWSPDTKVYISYEANLEGEKNQTRRYRFSHYFFDIPFPENILKQQNANTNIVQELVQKNYNTL